ncbi:glycosyltransferase family 39 protein [Terriglobus aquaticus]|uniref:Glycosyltransferase family 39 protein n=1 Tax=Terriglobus aquaticus TaxID=940139 RepID=A0ABW9KIR3_9BACT|nr:glycosyltransferase family 39 protein [Terriglobus aquaticus]
MLSRQADNRLSSVLVATTAVLVALCLWYNHAWFYDDTDITLRYARHLAQGLGPRWNIAGPPVEGFTSPLHVFAVAALLKLHVADRLAVRLISFAGHIVLLAFLWRWTRARFGQLAAVLTTCAVAVSFPLLVWDLGGLEAVPFAALCTAGTLFCFDYLESSNRRDLLWGGVLLGIAAFTRMDGAVAAIAALLAVLLLSKAPLRQRVIDVVLSGLIVVASLVPWQIFRELYFHAPLPNTYYAKVYGIPLGWRVRNGLLYWKIYLKLAPYPAEILFLIAVVQLLRRRVSRLSLALWLWLLIMAAYIVTTGGDHMFAARFMVTLVPIFALASVIGLLQIGALSTPALASSVAALFLVTSALQFRNEILNPRYESSSSLAGTIVGNSMRALIPAGSLVGLNVAGAMPYVDDDLNYIDMLGLNDYEIARRNPVPIDPAKHPVVVGHLKGDGLSVLRRHPDVLLLGPPSGQLAKGWLTLGDSEIVAAPEFARDYRLCSAPLIVTPQERAQLALVHLTADVQIYYYVRRGSRVVCERDLSQAQ